MNSPICIQKAAENAAPRPFSSSVRAGLQCLRQTGGGLFHPADIRAQPLQLFHQYSNPDRDFIFRRERDGRSFALDTRELREILGEEVKLSAPEVSEWIQGYLKEQTDMIFGGAQEDENIS